MSAAAMAVPKNWESSGWTKTPRAFFKKLFRVFSQVELGVLGNILDDSVGRRGEADWVEVREPELARLVNCHVNSVGAALDKLEALSAERNQWRQTLHAVVFRDFATVAQLLGEPGSLA